MASVDITLQQLYDMIKSGAAGVPIGTIVDYYGTTAPSGWLICNGQNVPDSMPQLKALIGSKVPDLRGRFRRMIGGNAAGIGVQQGDAIRNITASWDFDDHNGSQLSGAVYQASQTYSGGFKNEGEAARKLIFDASRVVPTAAENRPINIAFNAIIYGGG